MSENTDPIDSELDEATAGFIEVEPTPVQTAASVRGARAAADSDSSGPAEYAESEGGRTGRGSAVLRVDDIDYKNVTQLSRFLDRRGRILSRRKTRASARVQRKIAQAVKRARHLALLPYTADQTRVVRKRR